MRILWEMALQEEATDWQALSDGSGQYRTCLMELPQGKERWVIVRTEAGEQAKRRQMEKKVEKAKAQWEKKLWHLSTQEFACQTDAASAWKQAIKRGFRFLKDRLFLASSVFVKKPERVMALSFIMVLCLFVSRLAEHVLRPQLQATSQTVPNQVNKPTDRPTMRWIASRALRGLTCSTCASDHTGKPKFWGYNLFINVFCVCLALPFVNSIFSLRKLRNVGLAT